MPISCTGSTPNDTTARISMIVPTVPENTWPGHQELEHDQGEAEPEEDEGEVGVEQGVQEPDEPAHRAGRSSTQRRRCRA